MEGDGVPRRVPRPRRRGSGCADPRHDDRVRPTLLAKVLDLNATHESSLALVFHYADQAGLPLVDLEDLRAVASFLVSDDGRPELKALGGLSASTAGVILRELIGFADQGAGAFFGEPEFDTADLMRTDADGLGVITRSSCPICRTGRRSSRRS